MCGIAGFWSNGTPSQEVGTSMARCIQSRGPDDAGVWGGEVGYPVLAHRRLSILDRSLAGHQPMRSPCGRYVLVYNGEIYNHLDLREELAREGGEFDWYGRSDTETLLAALRHWGVQGALERLNGMFAFALWDCAERRLFLARDRMGEKPLYYGCSGGIFLFGSELKALAAHPEWQGQVDRNALALYMRYKCVPSPWSIYQGIKKLPPASYVVVRDQGRQISEPVYYWSLRTIAEEGLTSRGGEPEELLNEFDELLQDSVRWRMVADVPLGAFLSGGYDSTAVASVMQANSSRPINTFSIGFKEQGYDEATHARAVAEHLGTQHTELYVTPDDALAVIPKLPQIYDEPFAGSSQIPMFLVSQLARQSVTVALSGDGGDELFGGYNRHVVGPRVWNRVNWLPRSARYVLARGIRAMASAQRATERYLPSHARIPQLGVKLDKLASAMGAASGPDFYRGLLSLWKRPEQLVLEGCEPAGLLERSEEWPDGAELRELMFFWDMAGYLPDEILTKVDRASMAVGLEARVPFLDHRLVEFSWRVPTPYKVREGQGKWLLRKFLYRHVPREIMERPKKGFGVPIGEWLRGPLREWAESLLEERKLRSQGLFDSRPIRKSWEEHLQGKSSNEHELWAVLMFQAWLESASSHG